MFGIFVYDYQEMLLKKVSNMIDKTPFFNAAKKNANALNMKKINMAERFADLGVDVRSGIEL